MAAMRLRAVLACALAVAGAACGSTPAAVTDGGFATPDGGFISCTLVQFFDAGTGTLCFEVPKNNSQGLQQSCAQNAAAVPPDAGFETFTDGPCSRVDALGACRTSVDGVLQDQWYYRSGDDAATSVFNQHASDIMSLCALMNATYLPPSYVPPSG
jgi:hypothetical protein